MSDLEAAPTDASQLIRVEVDGESPGRLLARFDVKPGALRIRMPAR